MNNDYKIIIAFVYTRAGKKEMSFSEFYLSLSMDLKWFTLHNAKMFTKMVVENNLLKLEKEVLKPNFDVDKIKIPIGYTPSKNVLSQKDLKKETVQIKPEEDTLETIIKKIVDKSNLDKKTILSQIKEIEKEKNLTAEIAAILLGKEYALDFKEILKKIQNSLL
jgi:hypothetical protein